MPAGPIPEVNSVARSAQLRLDAPISGAASNPATWRLRCLACAGQFDAGGHDTRCARCGGVTEPVLAVRNARVRDAATPEQAFADFLPGGLADLVDAGTSIRTPTVRLAVLERELGLGGLWVKDETGQPTGSTKDRCAALVLAVFRAAGVRRFVASSTGNTARALARAVARDSTFAAHFVVGSGFPAPPEYGMPDRISSTIVDGSYGDATRVAEALAATGAWTGEGGFGNWARREGAKLAYLEAFLDLPRPPDVVVQAVSSGLGILAADKAARELTTAIGRSFAPRYVAVQEGTCAPMVGAFNAQRAALSDDDVVRSPRGLATAILHGDPRLSYPYLHAVVRGSDGQLVAVSQAEILQAGRRLLDEAGIEACHASSAALAGLIQLARSGDLASGATVLVKVSGRLLPAENNPWRSAKGTGGKW